MRKKASNPKKRKTARKGFGITRAKSIAKRINSMQTRVAFVAELAMQCSRGNIDRTVLTTLRLQISSSNLPKDEKKARRAIVKDFQKRPYI